MSKYIDAEKLISEIRKESDKEGDGDAYDAGYDAACLHILLLIRSLQQEQPDNEDIDKVAQELYEHLYELKRRNNVPTNLYDKQEIIDLWKAGIEYGRNHPKQEQPEADNIKREWYNKGYLKGRQEAHIPARELGLPKAFDFKPLDEDFERDAVSFCFDNGLNTTPRIAKTIARHFYELGLRRAVEMHDDIEYNR